MKCVICKRPLKRAAAMVGKMAIGPRCLRQIVVMTPRSKAVRLPQPELFEGCFFDAQGALDRVAIWGGA